MSNLDEKIKQIVSKDLELPEKYTSSINAAFKKLEPEATLKYRKLKLSFATAFCSLFLITGLVFADDIGNFIKEKFNYVLGDGINTAIENGYIEEPKNDFLNATAIIEEYGKSKETLNLGIKVNSFIVDENYGFNTEISFKFDSNLNNYINLFKEINGNYDFENSYALQLTDLIVLNHNKEIVFLSSSITEDQFNSFCNDHNLDYSFSDYSNLLPMPGLEGQVENHDKSTNTLKYLFNLNLTEEFSKSQSLDFYFTEITFRDKGVNSWNSTNEIENQKYNNLILKGDWHLHFDIPEYMYNNENIPFEVISCSNKDFEILKAEATPTGFIIDLNIYNLEKPIHPEYPDEFGNRLKEVHEELEKDGKYVETPNTRNELIEFLGDEKYVIMYENFIKEYRDSEIILEDTQFTTAWEDKNIPISTITNSSNEKFNLLSNKSSGIFIDNTIYHYNGIFEMTKYDISDEICITLVFKGTPVEIILNRTN